MLARPRVYLAGPDVFLPNAKAIGAEKKRLCFEAGFEGCFPLDAALTLDGLSKQAQAEQIYSACETMMRSCDLAIANCTPFRGVSIDSGTAYEIGFMRALGRPVFGYTNAFNSYAERAAAYRQHGVLAADCDRPDVEIENFDLPENLMIALGCMGSGSPIVGPVVHGPVDLINLEGFRQIVSAARSQILKI
jgi:nucleoside 2-deoxyribosyltransferase